VGDRDTVGLHREGGRHFAPFDGKDGANQPTMHPDIKSQDCGMAWLFGKRILLTFDIFYKVKILVKRHFITSKTTLKLKYFITLNVTQVL